MGRDGFAKIREIFTGYYKTPANQPDVNLRWSNVIADLLVPQRALMGGWAMGVPALYLLLSSAKAKSMRQTVLLALWASCLPLVHTHTFLALGLFSGGYLLCRLIQNRQDWRGVLARAGVYLGIVLLLALPQLLSNAIRQTVEGGVMRIQFNWVNNNGGMKLIDGYFFFWVKNVGLPFILMLCACLNARRRGQLDILCGMAAIFIVADWLLFQRNPYDNNKLFYIWYMFGAILAADYGSVIMQRLDGLRGRYLLAALFKSELRQQIFLSCDAALRSDFSLTLSRKLRDRDKNSLVLRNLRRDRLFETLLPALRERGIGEEVLQDVLIGNPRRYFCGGN
jgi:hypothetical protein